MPVWFYRFTLLVVLACGAPQAGAGFFDDDEARAQIRQIEARLTQLDELLLRLDQTDKKQARAILDLQLQIETQNNEIRKLRGLNEELVHSLQDAEKRQRDFYVDLDGRLRRFEAVDTAIAEKTGGSRSKAEDPATENRAFEAAYSFYKAERYQNAVSSFQDFLRSYPQSVHAANVHYWLGNAYFSLKDYKNSLSVYQKLLAQYDTHPRLADALLNMADCQLELEDKPGARQTLKLIVEKFPNSSAANEAKKLLATLK